MLSKTGPGFSQAYICLQSSYHPLIIGGKLFGPQCSQHASQMCCLLNAAHQPHILAFQGLDNTCFQGTDRNILHVVDSPALPRQEQKTRAVEALEVQSAPGDTIGDITEVSPKQESWKFPGLFNQETRSTGQVDLGSTSGSLVDFSTFLASSTLPCFSPSLPLFCLPHHCPSLLHAR